METAQTPMPYGAAAGSKKLQVATMFDAIAPKYDFLNHALSLGIDILWRRRAVRMLAAYKPELVIDIATGTGDFAIEAAKQLKPQKIIGVDISENMLGVGREKMARKGLSALIEMRSGDSEKLFFDDNYADAITVGFGVRNFEHLEQGLAEILRVLKPGKAVVILEPAVPTRFPLKQLFQFYFLGILPLIGRLVSKDPAAYTYLPQSVQAFPNGADFVNICQRVGFRRTTWHSLTFGICSLYLLEK